MISIGGIDRGRPVRRQLAAIAAVGPAVVLSYLIAGLLVLLVMRMLAEMASACPRTQLHRFRPRGSGGGAGFVVGWLYWYFWMHVVPVEAIAGAACCISGSPCRRRRWVSGWCRS